MTYIGAMIYVDISSTDSEKVEARTREVEAAVRAHLTTLCARRSFSSLAEVIQYAETEAPLKGEGSLPPTGPMIMVYVTNADSEDEQSRFAIEEMLECLRERIFIVFAALSGQSESAKRWMTNLVETHPRNHLIEVIWPDEKVAEALQRMVVPFVRTVRQRYS